MTKEVRITVRGVQRSADGDETVTETAADGEYYQRDGSHYLLYEEVCEDGSIKNLIKQREAFLQLTRKGAVSAVMRFEPGQIHGTEYATPYGLLRLGVKTHRLDCMAEGNRLEIQAAYDLTVGEEIISECEICIRAEAIG